ncbi:hypothetical protein E0H35_30430 [Rhizobium leguminosarum bv. viciae]|uniref:hypothetical protein n=1 Tax=Rhizobium leguminosarum TaxID=384 RepID=UPI00103A483E|nr:hypothetical protein [Rhizobium leguminosarum]MBY5340412.1 hypothetical protein [Rhizobium leguminosarum]NKK49312.1 hypothetical protein [Rhizobium leguminosarum bv. viciae]TBY90853.1 hypothetical protein E0H35_30430 [Rhizobium leguminosarum bv. viciae]
MLAQVRASWRLGVPIETPLDSLIRVVCDQPLVVPWPDRNIPRQILDHTCIKDTGAFPGRSKSNALAFSQIDDIVTLARNQGQRSALADAFIALFPSLSVGEIRMLAPAARELGGTANLEKNTSALEQLGDDQLSAVVEGFPGSKPLQRALDQRTKNSG